MTTMWTRLRSFDRGVRLLMFNQLTINAAFFMLMPYLAFHLTESVGMAVWAVGLVLGTRNLCQQGMFLIGGGLADVFGYKAAIMAGCVLRTVGFAALGFADSLIVLLLASAATGFAGALFNPAVRAYLAQAAGERRVEAFALFNVFYQVGSLAGPLVGMALIAVDFSLVAVVAAALFLVLTVLQALALPRRGRAGGESADVRPPGVLADTRKVFADTRFLVISLAMAGSYVLGFQVYLALPLATRQAVIAGGLDAVHGQVAVAALFVVSALVTIAGQVRLASWVQRRWGPEQALPGGVLIMAAAFLPMLLSPVAVDAARGIGSPLLALAVVTAPGTVTVGLLGLGTMLAYPFEMDTVVRLAGKGSVALHYGLYNTVSGIGITVGNLVVGAGLDADPPVSAAVVWLCLAGFGAVCALVVWLLGRAGWYAAPPVEREPTGPTRG
ncbi:MFS transporter [Nocardiopsis sp. NPDC006139]|uniref:MFS transporter n=1 Tax=Nocardiopsis sp. NPDC006139 TaxID=3154578 RepID=UPI0033ADF784